MKKPSHKQQIISYLKQGNTITQRQASDYFGCDRLSPRIGELIHKDGYDIESKMIQVKKGTRIAVYSLNKM